MLKLHAWPHQPLVDNDRISTHLVRPEVSNPEHTNNSPDPPNVHTEDVPTVKVNLTDTEWPHLFHAKVQPASLSVYEFLKVHLKLSKSIKMHANLNSWLSDIHRRVENTRTDLEHQEHIIDKLLGDKETLKLEIDTLTSTNSSLQHNLAGLETKLFFAKLQIYALQVCGSSSDMALISLYKSSQIINEQS